MLKRPSPTERVGDLVVGLMAALVHGEEVGQHLRPVPLLGESVVDRDAGVPGELLDVLLAGAAVLDRVEHAAEHPPGVGDRLLVAHLRAGRIQVRDVCSLIEGGDLERAARAGRALLEDQGDLLARQARRLVAGVLGGLQRLRERQHVQQLVAGEVDLLEEAAIAQVVHA
jgi:hypothetical protein